MKLTLGALLAGTLIAGCGGSTAAAPSVAPARQSAAAASCAGLPPAQQFAEARRVFVGRMLPGPSLGPRQVLASPARIRIVRYLKGVGARTVKVRTAVTITKTGVSGAEDGIEPRAGETWKIYTDSRHQPFDSSLCGGSRRLETATRHRPPAGS